MSNVESNVILPRGHATRPTWWAVAMLIAMLLPTSAIAQPELTSDRFGELIDNFHRDTPGWPTSGNVAKWTREARMTTWGYANSATLNEIDTPEEAAARAREIKSNGYNIVIYSGRHYRQSYRDPDALNDIIANMKLAADACHAEGLKIIDHNDFTLWYARAYPLLFENPDWTQVDIRNGQTLRWFCLSDPGFTQDVINLLMKMQRETNFDGYMIDEVSFRPESCGCEDCRNGFEKDTGYRLPEDNDNDVYFNRDHPLWRLWLQWRFKTAAEFRRRIQESLEVIEPDLIWITYSTNLAHPSGIDTSGDVYQRARLVNFPGFEGTNIVYPGYAFLHAGMRTVQGFNRAHNRHGWAQYPCSDRREYEFAAFMSALDAKAPWFSSMAWDAGGETFSDPAWPRLTAPREPVADVAVIFSTATRDRQELNGRLFREDYYGWCQTLIHAGIPFESIPDHSADQWDLSRYDAIIVPACRAMPTTLSDRLESFVADGGTLLATGSLGYWDGWGFDVDQPLQHRLLGVESMTLRDEVYEYKAQIRDTVPSAITLTDAGAQQFGINERDITIEQGAAWAMQLDKRDRQVLATFDGDNPAITLTPIGDGRIVHYAFQPGRDVFEEKLHRKRGYEGRSNPQMTRLINASFDRIAGATQWTRVKGDGVMNAIYRDGDRAVVHLLNVAGVPDLEPGERVTDQHAIPNYPSLGEIEVQLSGMRIADPTLIEPDTDKTMPLRVQYDGEIARIIVPAESFTRYAAIEMEVE